MTERRDEYGKNDLCGPPFPHRLVHPRRWCRPEQPPVPLEPLLRRLGVPDMKQRPAQPPPGDSPQEFGVFAAPATESLVHTVALEQIGMHDP